MHQQLKLLHQILEEINNNPQQTLQFFTTDNKYRIEQTTPTPDCKWLLIGSILHRIEHEIQQSTDCISIDPCIEHHLNKLNDLYQNHQQHCWISHQHHFHTDFQQYVNCPMTCLVEITEYLNKLIRDLYVS